MYISLSLPNDWKMTHTVSMTGRRQQTTYRDGDGLVSRNGTCDSLLEIFIQTSVVLRQAFQSAELANCSYGNLKC